MIDLKSPQVAKIGQEIFTIFQTQENRLTNIDMLECFTLYVTFAIKYAAKGDKDKIIMLYEAFIKQLGGLMEITPNV